MAGERSRPSWRCGACGAPWPCSPARLALLAEYAADPVALSVYLGVQLHDAVADLHRLNPQGPGPDAGELFERFLGWTRSRP